MDFWEQVQDMAAVPRFRFGPTLWTTSEDVRAGRSAAPNMDTVMERKTGRKVISVTATV